MWHGWHIFQTYLHLLRLSLLLKKLSLLHLLGWYILLLNLLILHLLTNLLILHLLLGLVLRLNLLRLGLLRLNLLRLRLSRLVVLRRHLSLPAAAITPHADVHDELPLRTRQQFGELVRDPDHQIVILRPVVSRVQYHDDPSDVRARDGYPHDGPYAPLLAPPHPFEVVEGGVVDRLLPRREAHVIYSAGEAAAYVKTSRAEEKRASRRKVSRPLSEREKIPRHSHLNDSE